MILGALAVLGDPVQLTAVFGLKVIALRPQQVLGVQAGLNALGELDLLGGVEQRHLADLLEVVLDRIRGGPGGHHLLRRLIGLVGVGDREGAVLVLVRTGLPPGSLARRLLGLLTSDAIEFAGQGRDGGLHLDALDDPAAEDEAVARQELAGDNRMLLLGDHEAGHRTMAVGGQGDRLLKRAIARQFEPLDGGAAAHVEGCARCEPDALESRSGVEGIALGAVAVLLQAHIEVVVPQLGKRLIVILRFRVIRLIGSDAVLTLLRVIDVIRVLVLVVVVLGVVIEIVEIEIIAVLGSLVNVISAL